MTEKMLEKNRMSVELGLAKTSTTYHRDVDFRQVLEAVIREEAAALSEVFAGCYLAFRRQGKRIDYHWFGLSGNAVTAFDFRLSKLTCPQHWDDCHVELLYAPETRVLSLNHENVWNKWRGVRAAVFTSPEGRSKWSALEMIAQNISFSKAAHKHLLKYQISDCHTTGLPVTLYWTRQYRLRNEAPWSVSRLFRGNRFVAQQEVDRPSLLAMCRAMTGYLVRQVDSGGKCAYKYWPSRGRYSNADNAIRQWMATLALIRSGRFFNSHLLETVTRRNLRYNLEKGFITSGDLGYIAMGGSAKLGAAALAGLALLESEAYDQYTAQEEALFKLTAYLQNPDGSFRTFWYPKERNDCQNFYPGETLLYWVTRFVRGFKEPSLGVIHRAIDYYGRWHGSNRNPAFVPWHTQAYYLLWQHTGEPDLVKRIFEMNDWLLDMQQIQSAPFPDMVGRFYNPSRPDYGPPHASSTGVYMEGLVDAWQLACKTGDRIRAETYRKALLAAMRNSYQLTFRGRLDGYYLTEPEKVIGGLRTTEYDNTIRIDNVQHTLMAFLKTYERFDVGDYQLCTFERTSAKGSRISVATTHHYSSKCKHSILWHRDEVLSACSIIRAHNDRSWVAKSVTARSHWPGKGSLYFAKESASDELRVLGENADQPAAIIAISNNARILAEKVSCPVYEVTDPLETARSLADFARSRTSAKIVGITGSVGKTSVKDALSQLLALQGQTHDTKRNANDGWGVLDTAMNLPANARYGVMELGMLGEGSVKIKSIRTKPHVGIITNVHDAHLAYHNDESSIAHTKSGLFDGLTPDGVAILPRDSSWYDFLKARAEQAGIQQLFTFGNHTNADFRLLDSRNESGQTRVNAKIFGEPVSFRIGAAGSHWAINAMAILAAVHALGASVTKAIGAMHTIKPSFRRGEVYRVRKASKDYVVIDDTWNASPVSVAAALENMASIQLPEHGRRILFLGDMLQLGEEEVKKHLDLVNVIVSSGIDKVFTVGRLSHYLFRALPQSIQGKHFPDAVSAAKAARGIVGFGDVVLVKGSNALSMYRVVRSLMVSSDGRFDSYVNV